MKGLFIIATAVASLLVSAASADAQQDQGGHTEDLMMIAPPGGDFQKVSDLVELPDYLPGIGTLYVDPATLPAGPFLAYDRGGRLVSSIYMIPLSQIGKETNFDDLGIAPAMSDHVDIYYNAGHPGVDEPHLHFVVWTVSPDKAAALK